jgi:zinc D-Ala-D-Ala carboxypeptidase
MNLAPNFTKAEMQCHHCGLCLMQDKFMENLQALRKEWGRSITVTSGYRCKTHNQAVGGKPSSQHLAGNAADLDISHLSEEEKKTFIVLCRVHFTGIGIAKTFIHCDLGPAREWTYP